MMSRLLLASATFAVAQSASVTLATFDGATGTTFSFTELNDPVMGGKSTGTWTVDSANKVGVFDGDVAIVPSLKAPGFIKTAAKGTFPDASSVVDGDLVLSVRSKTPEYKGFRVSFFSGYTNSDYACAGGGSLPLSRGCFKAKFSVPAGDDFQTIRIPLNTFSDMWSPSTGEQTKTCSSDKDVCPTADKLKKIERMEVWAEGAEGKVHLEIQSIAAGKSASAAVALMKPPPIFNSDIVLVSFDQHPDTTFTFKELNDPVMGGKSHGGCSLDQNQDLLSFDGEVVDVPKLQAPGFIEIHADGNFRDVSTVAQYHPDAALILTVRTNTSYDGWKVSLVSGTLSPTYACATGGGMLFGGGCYKAPFKIAPGSDWVQVLVPFTLFTDQWDSKTGNPTKTCQQSPSACLTPDKLKKIQRIEIMAEGVAGKVHLEILNIIARTAVTEVLLV